MFPPNTKFLIVDDSTLMQNFLTQALKKLGYENTTKAGGGREALSLLKSANFVGLPFDFVLSDVWMLDMNGKELLQECRVDPELKETRFIFITAERNKAQISEITSIGAAGFIFKPVSEASLKQKLEEIFKLTQSKEPDISFQILSQTTAALESSSGDFQIDSESTGPILNLLPGFVVKADPSFKIYEVNNYLRAVYNVSPSQILSPDLLKSIFSAPSPKLTMELRANISEENHYFHLVIQRYNEDSEALIIGTPITSQRKAEENLKSLTSKINGLEEMAASIAYQLNIPILVLQTRATRLQKLAKFKNIEPSAVMDNANKIEESAQRVKTIVKSLKTFVRGEHKEALITVNVKDLVEEAMEVWRGKFGDHNIHLLTEEITDAQIECRHPEISLVLLNLISNSFDAMEKLPEQSQDKWISINAIQKNEFVEISVVDSGNGIPEHIREKLTRPYFAANELSRGTGMGLSICKGIIEDHNGTLTIDADYPNTRVVITLPRLV